MRLPFRRTQKPATPREPRTYRYNPFSLYWFNYEQQKLVGWKSPRPEAGDIFLVPMQSGRMGKFIFKDVDYCMDPKDMFFGIVEGVGYADDARERESA